jgi:hypothetical protein
MRVGSAGALSLAAVFVPFAQVPANFFQHLLHLFNLVAQLIHFIPTIVIMVFLVPVSSMDAPFNFLRQIMEPGGMQVLDCGHGMVDSFVRMFAMAFIVMSFNLLPQVPLYTVCFFMPSLFV